MTRTVLFYPSLPIEQSMAEKVCRRLGHTITNALDAPFDRAVHWEDTTYPVKGLDSLPRGAINGRCQDISKSQVDRCFAEVFGYGVGIDPLTHAGPCVEKSELNFAHDGKVIGAPIARARRSPCRRGRS
jgi:hypothetical protein